MYSLRVENNRGDSLQLTDNGDYTVYKITGLTPPKATVNSSVNATTDGSSINSVRLNNRNIVIYAKINGDVESNRINLYKYFPLKKSVKLYFDNENRSIYIEGVVELIECDMFSNKQVAQISIICPKPYFKAVNDLIVAFGDVANLFSFPFAISEMGVELSAIQTSQRKSIINAGDIETGVVIELFATGTVENPVIYDVLKRTHFKLNFTMTSGDLIVINTNVGEKSVELIRAGIAQNIMGYMSQDNTWFKLEAGDNVFTYATDSGNSNLQITFTSNVLYCGV